MRYSLAAVTLATLTGLAAAQQPWIDMPTQRATTFNSATTRGFQCTAPIDFTVVGVEVPDPNALGRQSVAVFRMTAQAPQFAGSTTLTPAFQAIDLPSGSIIPVTPPVDILGSQGEWIGVLGACNTGPGATMNNPYATAGGVFASGKVGGQTVSVYRFLTQTNLSTLAPNGTVVCSSEDAGNVSLVYVYVVAHGGDVAAPTPGSTVTLTCESGLEAGSPGVPYACALSFGTAGIPVPGGTLPLTADSLFFLTVLNLIPPIFPNGQGTLNADAEGSVTVNLPNLPALVGTKIYSAFITTGPMKTVSKANVFQIS
jgi:hypothetical protein